jgi:hypothetical protein
MIMIATQHLFSQEQTRNQAAQKLLKNNYLVPVLWIRAGFNADPDPGSQTNADPCKLASTKS